MEYTFGGCKGLVIPYSMVYPNFQDSSKSLEERGKMRE